MNLTQSSERVTTTSPNRTELAGQSSRRILDSRGLMGHHGDQKEISGYASLDAHGDARAIVRLVQCSRCSRPLQRPLTLPCGNSLCRACLPQSQLREEGPYPNVVSRQPGFLCPFHGCDQEHSVADCSLDVTLAKLMDVIANEIARYRPVTSDTPMMLEEISYPSHADDKDLPSPNPPRRSRVLHGGRLVATYTLVEMGELDFTSDVSYQNVSESQDDYQYLDVAVLEHLKEVARNELDCHVCYGLMVDPITTSCGHTFCRKCLYRVFDHSNLCPICRRKLAVFPSLATVPSNSRLLNLLASLCPDHLAARVAAVAQEESGEGSGLNTPMFVCTLSFPTMPTFLHVFEPRYRLMIRRAMNDSNRKFGMLMYNSNTNNSGQAPGTSPRTPFMQYGTLLHIKDMETLRDGRLIIETVGVSRFRVVDWGLRDEYTVAHIERVEDMSRAEEERLEAEEMGSPPALSHDLLGQLDRLPTQALLQIGINFITEMQASSATWLHERVLSTYGNPPDDPALFPFWFASILPISDEEKYRLLPTTSIRERLKITARWVRRLQAQRW
ncbi:MAG: hypothetical protein M1837_003616 [Sclerophora amabilis]|nr:MAG: hypothetical protein M1837_003616 [Sclerophora amabilis]